MKHADWTFDSAIDYIYRIAEELVTIRGVKADIAIGINTIDLYVFYKKRQIARCHVLFTLDRKYIREFLLHPDPWTYGSGPTTAKRLPPGVPWQVNYPDVMTAYNYILDLIGKG